MRPGPLPPLLCALALLTGCAPVPVSPATPAPTTSPTPPPVETAQPPRPTQAAAPLPLQVLEGLSGYALAYAQVIVEAEAESDGGTMKYDLVYLDEDEVPELVVGHPGYFVSVYQYDSGTLYPVMDQWGYGAMGNHGYEYLPRGNVIRNYNADLAGAIVYDWYGRLGGGHEIESYYDESLSTWMFLDKNGNYQIDEDEPFSDQLYYYYGHREITEAEYDAYQIPGDYQYLIGSQSAACLLAQLQAAAQKEEWGLKGQVPDYAYRDEEGNLQLELYFDPEAGTGRGFRYQWAYLDRGIQPSCERFTLADVEEGTWEERSPFSVLSVAGHDGSDMVQDYRETWEYDEAGRPVSFRSTGVSDFGPDPIDLISVDFQYRYDGTLERKEYGHQSMLFSTTLSSAVVHYDREERPALIRGYITHDHLEFYPIYGEKATPDDCLMLDFNLDRIDAVLYQFG